MSCNNKYAFLGMFARILILSAAWLLLSPTPSHAQQLRIAAVVNDEVISLYDLELRTRLAIITSGLTDSPEARRRIGPQVLRKLIEEKLQIQEATRLGIAVTDADIAMMRNGIEQQNRMPAGGLLLFLSRNGIDANVINDQMRAEVAWLKVVKRSLLPTVKITEEEIDGVLETIKQSRGKPEYLAAEILLTVDSSAQESDIRNLAERLIEQIRSGADFPAVARQFSQSATAAVGGDLGWVGAGQLEDEVEQGLRNLQPGQLSPAIRTPTGYHIVILRDRRTSGSGADTVYVMSQAFLPVGKDASPADEKSQSDLLAAIAETANGCAEFDPLAKELKTPNSGPLGNIRPNMMPPDIRAIVDDLPEGKASKPIKIPGGIAVIMVCSRKEGDLPDREDLQRKLEFERSDLLARRLLRDLRRSAFVDVRI